MDEAGSPKLSLGVQDRQNDCEAKLNGHNDERMDNQRIETTTTLEEKTVNCEDLNIASRAIFEKTQPGTLWDVFRRPDVPKLIEYLRIHWKDFG